MCTGDTRAEEEVNMKWNTTLDKEVLVNFISLDLMDARKLVNALIARVIRII